jgi:hypothetical protein
VSGEFTLRNGSKEWRTLPVGFRRLTSDDRIAKGDVIQMHAERFSEYRSGLLVGTTPGHDRWFRFDPTLGTGIGASLTLAETITAVNALARKIAQKLDRETQEGHRFDQGTRAWETNAWQAAAVAYEALKGIHVAAAIEDVEESLVLPKCSHDNLNP